jgi:ABC-2 type transport system permease protein
MSLAAVARKDFQDSIRVKWFWALAALFVLFAGGAAYLYAEVLQNTEGTGVGFLVLLSGAAGTLIPVIGLVLGYKTIVGERESGSLKLLLGLPHTRGEVVVGKLIGRSAVVTIAIVIGYAVAAGMGLVLFDQFDVVDFAIFTLLSVLLAFAWIGISLGLSTATASTSRAMAAAFGFWLMFEFLWGTLVVPLLVWASNGFSGSLFVTSPPEWAQLLNVLPPTAAFSNANGVIADVLGTVGEATPWFTEPWFGLVVLLAWVVVPVGLGYLRFRSADL